MRRRGPTVRLDNDTSYPTREIRTLVMRELRALDVADWIHVKVSWSKDGYTRGRARDYWYPESGEDRPVILVKLPRPDRKIDDYVPYDRKREGGRTFPLADWREALVAVTAHEAEHHRQWRLGDRRHRRGSGSRRVDVELRCDLAAFRAWRIHRDRYGTEVAA
jgi:hypothetical protein